MTASLDNMLQNINAGAMDDFSMIDLFIGRDEDDQPYWAYVALLPSTYAEYRERLEQGEALDIEDYGEILFEGNSDLPPADVQKKMTAMGFEHNFEAEFLAALDGMR